MNHTHEMSFPDAHLRMPQTVKDFVRYITVRILDRLFGIVFGVLAIFLSLALYSYAQTDVSLNTVPSLSVTQNWMRQPGAFAADLLIQLWGVGSYLWVVIFAAWSGAIGQGTRVFPGTRRLIAALLAVTCAAALAAMSVAAPSLPTGSGGVIGRFLTGMAQTGILELDIAQWGLSLLLVLICLHLTAGSLWQMLKTFVKLILLPVRILKSLFVMMFFKKPARAPLSPTAEFAHAARLPLETDSSNFSAPMPPRRDDDPLAIHDLVNDADEDDDIGWQEMFGSADIGTPPRLSFMYDDDDDDAAPAPPVLRAAEIWHDAVCGVEFADADDADYAFTAPDKDETENEMPMPSRAPAPDFTPPSLSLLESVESAGEAMSDAQIQSYARALEQVLQSFKIEGSIKGARSGPIVTLYEFEPAAGVKTSRVVALAEDVARAMSAESVRIAPVSGTNVIGIELPNPENCMVGLREILQTREFHNHSGALPIVLGKDIGGKAVVADLAKMPHLLIAGTTGSGKSVGVNAMILSLLYRYPPEQCRMIMIDPKMLELSVYNDIPHLLTPVVTEPKRAVVALKWAVREMERRYQLMSEHNTRNIVNYNHKAEKTAGGIELLPYIVVVIDEMADLMLVAGKEIEVLLQRLAQMARAAGIHLITATQRPSVDVITGTIKANFPTRISYQVTSKFDSRTILGEQGAENLLGRGDMLFMTAGGKPTRVHGPFASDIEVERVCEFLKSQNPPDYVGGLTDEPPRGGITDSLIGGESRDDELYAQAIALVRKEQRASTSFIQRHLQIGYNRAARLIEQMERDNIISKAGHTGKRDILIAAE